MKSIRKRLLWFLIGGSISLLFLFVALLYWGMFHAINHSLNETLLTLAQRIAAQITIEGKNVALLETELQGVLPAFPFDDHLKKQFLYIQVWDSQKNIIYRSSSLQTDSLPSMPSNGESVHFESFDLPNKPRIAAAWISFYPVNRLEAASSRSEKIQLRLTHPGLPDSLTLAVAIPRESVDRIFQLLSSWLFGLSIVMLLFFTLSIHYIIKWSIKPITEIGEQIEAISDRDLNRRIDESNNPIEMKPFVEKINLMLSRLEYMFQKEKQFTADVSHELRTPLAAIRCSLDVAQLSECSEPSHQSQMRETIKSVDYLQKLIDDLLTLCRADSGANELNFEPVDVGEIITESVIQIMPLAKKHKIELEWDPPEERFPIEGDFMWLCRLFLNLLSNAIYYNQPNGWVKMVVQTKDKRVHVTIQDGGIGIPDDQLDRIFERFYRVDSSRDSSRGGTGLGLSIVRWIVEAHRGEIAVSSKLHKGTTFSIALPLPQ